MSSEQEQEIRKRIFLIVSERDPQKLRVLASELDRLLKLEGEAENYSILDELE